MCLFVHVWYTCVYICESTGAYAMKCIWRGEERLRYHIDSCPPSCLQEGLCCSLLCAPGQLAHELSGALLSLPPILLGLQIPLGLHVCVRAQHTHMNTHSNWEQLTSPLCPQWNYWSKSTHAKGIKQNSGGVHCSNPTIIIASSFFVNCK